MARLSLAQQLAELSNAAPAPELDPEAEGEDRRVGDEESGREHYADVGAASLRSREIVDPRYSGKRASRKSLFDEEDGSDDDADAAENVSDQSGDDAELDGEEEEESDEAEGEGEDAAASGSDETEEDLRPGSKTAAFAKDERAMVSQLRQAATADIEKGRDVRKQLALWDTLLEGRIRIQKILSSLQGLPQPSAFDAYRDEHAVQLNEALTDLGDLSSSLFALREDLLRANSTIEPPTRKRKRTDAFDLDTALRDVKALDEALTPHVNTTVTKWSDKVAAASSANRFVDRNTWSQIESTLQTDIERLVARTRKSRALGATSEGIEDPEVFDDGDFYQQLLKDVVESRTLDLDDGTLASLRAAGGDRSKRKKLVDTKASKGRKLRYHVHEKLVNFMAPQPQPGAIPWHTEQVTEFMASLLGKGFAAPPAMEAETPVMPMPALNGDGALRIFG